MSSELGKEREREGDVFRLVTSVGQRKNCLGLGLGLEFP